MYILNNKSFEMVKTSLPQETWKNNASLKYPDSPRGKNAASEQLGQTNTEFTNDTTEITDV